jgi:hypothetical protein
MRSVFSRCGSVQQKSIKQSGVLIMEPFAFRPRGFQPHDASARPVGLKEFTGKF